jgi:hypothetical protein
VSTYLRVGEPKHSIYLEFGARWSTYLMVGELKRFTYLMVEEPR